MKYETRDDYEWTDDSNPEGVTDEQIKGLLGQYNCSLDGNRDEWIDRIFDCKKGLDMYNEATSANENLEYAKASELYLEAALLSKKVGRRPIGIGKESEARGWFAKGMSMNPQSPEDHIELAKIYDKGVKACNIALEFGGNEVADAVNLRHNEGHKYSSLASAEIKKADRLPDVSQGEVKAEHYFVASEYVLSAASCHRSASEILLANNKMAEYHTQLGIFFSRTATSHDFCAWGNCSLENWEVASEELEKAKELYHKAIGEFQKSIKLDPPGKHVQNNVELAESDLKLTNQWLDDVRPKINQIAIDTNRVTKSEDSPCLDIRLESIEGMIENLVSTVTVNLENTGSANANNVQMELQSSFIDGETNASLTQIIAGCSARKGFSIIPSKAGKPNITLHISYSDPWGENYSNEIDAVIVVARREEERPPPATIINVKGDYIDDRDTIIQDSVISRSNIGTGEKSKAEELREAKALLDDGIIDDAEFKQMKKEILGK